MLIHKAYFRLVLSLYSNNQSIRINLMFITIVIQCVKYHMNLSKTLFIPFLLVAFFWTAGSVSVKLH